MTRQALIRRFLFGPAVALSCILLSGCIRDKIVIKVNKDGTGKIVVTKVYSREMVAGERSRLANKLYAGRDTGDATELADLMKEDAFFDKNALKKQARNFGEQVSLSSIRQFESGGARGCVAVYRFDDINDVFVDVSSLMSQEYSCENKRSWGRRGMSDEKDEEGESGAAEKGEDSFSFRLTPGSSAKLQIATPARGMELSAEEDDYDGDSVAPWGNTPGQVMMNPEWIMYYAIAPPMWTPTIISRMGAIDQKEEIRRDMRGGTFELEVEVEGTDVKSNATHADPGNKNRLTLLAFNADTFLASPSAMKTLQSNWRLNMMQSLQDFLATVAGMPGVVMETNREVVVEFK